MIELIKEIKSHTAIFKHNQNTMGAISMKVEGSTIVFFGFDVLGQPIEETTLDVDVTEITENAKISWKKVFWYIVKKAKKKLCPICPV